MTRSIWHLSGGPWMHWLGFWAAFLLSLPLLGVDVPAGTAAGEARPAAPAREALPTQRTAVAPESGRLVVTSISAFDFNRADAAGYGDVEPDAPHR